MDEMVKLGWHRVEIHQLEEKNGREELWDSSLTPLPSKPCHHPRIRRAIGRTGCDLYVCFWRGVLINSHERGPSIQPASQDALHWASLLFSPVHKNLGMEKKALILSMCASPNDAIRLVPALSEKGFSSAWSDLKDAGESCLQILFENTTEGEWGGKMPS